ncbi:MAG: TonB-dependent receptor [Desulfobacterales bacterium]|nr:TonB-dependent receptor [Desulfobacterales bacterium]
MKLLFTKFRLPLIHGAVCLSLVMGGTAAVVAETEEQEKKIVVTATRIEKDLQMVPASVSVVDAKEIRRKGYTSVADALKDVPGVEISDQSLAGSKRINIRGESGARVLIMVDGQKITEQKSMDGAPLLIDPETIDRIEVIKGPASVLYGSEAIGGAVNIITKKGGNRPLQASASVTYDSSTDGFTESLSLFGRKNNFHYRVTGSYSDQGNRETPDGELDESDSRRKSGSVFLGWEKDNVSIGVGLEGYDSKVDSPPITVSGNPFNLNLPKWSRNKGSLFVDVKDVTPKIKKIHLDAFVQETEKDFEQAMDINMGMVITQNINTFNNQKTYGINSQMDLIVHPSHYLVGGYSYSRDTLDADRQISYSAMLPGSDVFYDAGIDTHALFLQDEWVLPRDFVLTLGGRYTWVASELDETNDSSAIAGRTTDSHPVFSAGLTWSGIESLTIRGLASQGYRFPDLNKLFIGTRHGGAVTLPNQDLDPETSNNFEIGARYNTNNWNIDLAGFVNLAEDYITTQTIGTNLKQFANVDEARTYGVEAHMAYTFKPLNLTPYITGTWMRRKFESEDLTTWKTNTPKFSGRLGLRWENDLKNHPATVWFDAWMRGATKSEDEDSRGNVTENASWQTANLAVGSDFGRDRQYNMSLNLNNIFDHSYSTAQNALDEPGFHAVLRVGMNF